MNNQKQGGVGPGAFVAGALLGIGVGLLMAPKRGQEMRADIREMGDKAKYQFHKTKEAVRHKIADARHESVEKARQARERLEAKLRDMQPEDEYE